MLRIKAIRVNGYRSFGSQIVLSQLANVNLVIGPNNSGKSNLVRFMSLIHKAVREYRGTWTQSKHWREAAQQIKSPLRDDEYWRQNPKVIEAEFELIIGKPSDLNIFGPFMSDEGLVKVSILLIPEQSGARFEINMSAGPYKFVKLKDAKLLLWNEGNNCVEDPQENQSSIKAFTLLCEAIADGIYFVDPVRTSMPAASASPASPGESSRTNGSDIIGSFKRIAEDRTNSAKWIPLKRKLERFLRVLLGYSVTIESPNEMGIFVSQELSEEDHIRLPLDDLGTGVSQFIILLGFLLLNPDESRVVVIEEPEAHLHPGAALEMVRTITREFPKVQLLLTTHSTSLVDGVDPNWNLIRTNRTHDGITRFNHIDTSNDRLALLADLGVRPSQLFSANCVIWVEGPSDVFYFRRLLHEKAEWLVEGRSHAYVIYGGSAISHLSLDESGLVRLLSISPTNIVVCDRDRKKNEGLKPHVQALLETADSLSENVLVQVLPEREIELCVRAEVMSLVANRLAPAVKIDNKVVALSFNISQWSETSSNFTAQMAAAAFRADGGEMPADVSSRVRDRLEAMKVKISRLISQERGDVFLPSMAGVRDTITRRLEQANARSG